MTDRATWIRVTTNLRAEWDRAQAYYFGQVAEWRHHPDEIARVYREAARRRAQYVAGVIAAWWACCAPVRPDTCVPNEVAECLAEEWDERTRWRDRRPS